MADYTKLKPFILRWEGGYVCDKDDLGGATNKGITLATYRQYYGQNKTAADLKRITDQQWEHIFKTGYWDKWLGDKIESQSVANMVVDWVWCSGAAYGIKIPQRVLGVTADGIVGAKTIAALNAQDPKTLFNRLKQERLNFIDRICQTRPQNKKYRKGWLSRINSIAFQ